MHLYIIGANGQLGTALQKTCPEGGSFTAISRAEWDLNGPCPAELHSHLTQEVESDRPCVLINCAAHTDVEGAQDEENFRAAYRLNVLVPGLIGTLATSLGVPAIHISTDYVYPGSIPPAQGAVGADLPEHSHPQVPAPINMYGLTKYWGEQEFLAQGGTAIVRTSWLYSGPANPESKDIANTFSRLYPREISVVSDQWGCPTNAFDLARGLWSYAEKVAAGTVAPGTIIDAHNEGATTWLEFARHIYITLGGAPDLVKAVTTAEYGAKAPRPLYNVNPATDLVLPPWQPSLERALHGKL
ncbi:MAG: sugar nucleotide-binding protein [Corynebacterium sp.]|nr:sugar nucleotide-binding protein [Corynebacterium sp.]